MSVYGGVTAPELSRTAQAHPSMSFSVNNISASKNVPN